MTHISLRALLLCVIFQVSVCAADTFAGTWKYTDGEFVSTAKLTIAGTELQGVVIEGAATYSVKGSIAQGTAQVAVLIDGESVPATLRVQGDQLMVAIAGENLVYVRQAKKRPGIGGAVGAKGTTTTPPANTAKPAPTGTMVLKRHTLKDQGMRGMDSHTVVVPQGWKVEGGAWWPNTNFFKILPSQDIKVTSPEGIMVHVGPSIGAVDYFPSQQAQQLGVSRPQEGAVDNGYPVIHYPGDLAAWGNWLQVKGIPLSFPGATDIQVETPVMVPELTTLLKRQLQPIVQSQAQSNQQAKAMGAGTALFCDGSVMAAHGRYTLDGKKWEHLFIFGVTVVGLDSQMGRQLWWSVEPSVSYRAEDGALEKNLPLLFTIANSVMPTPSWAKMKADHVAKMNQIQAKGAAERSRILAKSSSEIGDIIHKGWQDREAIRDKTNQKVIDTIRGVERYTDPMSNSPVELPNTYQHVYSNGVGDYIMTNDHLYNPNIDAGVNSQQWNTLSPVP